jgi:2-keto-4-pentenoate hydratase
MAMTPDAIANAAQILADARRDGTTIEGLPAALRPVTPDDALAIQRAVAKNLGATAGGWKCSVPSAARPILCAPIFERDIVSASPAALPIRNGMGRIEPEVALVMGTDLPKRAKPYDHAEIRAAVREAHLVLELVAARYDDPGKVTYPELLADSVANYGLYVGPSIGDGSDPALSAIPLTVARDGAALSQHDGRHGDGHPLNPLYWLVNFLAERDEGLRAGQIVTTGSYAGLLEVPIDVPLTLTFQGYGTISFTLTST